MSSVRKSFWFYDAVMYHLDSPSGQKHLSPQLQWAVLIDNPNLLLLKEEPSLRIVSTDGVILLKVILTDQYKGMLPLLQLWTTLQGHPSQLQSSIQLYEAFIDTASQPNLPFWQILLPLLPSDRCWCQEHSLRKFLHTNLHLSVCFLENPTIDSWARSGPRDQILR